MNCENCCEAFVGTYEGYYVSKNDKKMRVCRCCKNEYVMMGWIGIKEEDEMDATPEPEPVIETKKLSKEMIQFIMKEHNITKVQAEQLWEKSVSMTTILTTKYGDDINKITENLRKYLNVLINNYHNT